ncbi:MAG: SH3 domain-containing protein [Anaerolineae bacterium]
MGLDSNQQPNRRRSEEDLWPTWMWIAVPVLVVVVVGGLWWAIFYPSETAQATPTPSPTLEPLPTQPTQSPTAQELVEPEEETTPTRDILSPPETDTPTPETEATPTEEAEPTEEEGLTVGAQATVSGTGNVGVNMRSGAGTSHARIKTLSEGTEVELIGGPKEANGYTWWEVRDDAGQTGWLVDEYLSVE